MDIDYPGQRADKAHRRWFRTAARATAAVAAVIVAPAVLAAEVTDVTFASTAGVYSAGGTVPDTIEINVVFDVDVYVSGTPGFNLMVGTDRRRMSYAGGDGTRTLAFEYTVRAGDLDEDGVGYAANALTGGTIRDSDNAIAERTFPALARNSAHTVDGVAPRLVSLQVTSNPVRRGTYAPTEVIELALEFDEDVDAAGTASSLTLILGGEEREATRGTVVGETVPFTYTVMAEDPESNGFTVPSQSFTVADEHRNEADRVTPALRSAQRVDGVMPGVVRTTIVSDPGADRTYGRGDEIVVEVAFSEPVVAEGSTFTLLVGPDESRTADYLSGDDTNRVRYRYRVRTGDQDADGISWAAGALGGTVTDRVSNALDPDRNVQAVTARTGHRVDAGEDNEPPRVTGVSVTSMPERADTYDIDDVIELTVEFNEPVSVGSASELRLDFAVGNAVKRAPFVAPVPDAPAAALRFRYMVVAGDTDTDGISIGPIAESLVGTTIRDPSGNTAIRDFRALPAQPRHKVDGTVPVVTDVAITSDAGPDSTYALGDEIEVRVDFSEPVVVHHDPELQLNLGIESAAVGTVPAILASGERTASLTFRYRVREGDLDNDDDDGGISIGATALAGGTVEDLAGNPADASQPGLVLADQPAHKVDAAPTGGTTVTVVSSAGSDRWYALGDLIEVQVQFTEEVEVSGPVELVLSFGANDSPASNLKRRATLARQTARRLTFHYRVQAGDLDEDGLGVDRNALVGGTVVDAFGNPARLLEPFVDEATEPLHRVDGIQPEVAGMQIVSVPNDGDTYGLGEDIEIEVSFSEVVHTNQELTLIVQVGGQARHAAFVDGSGTRTLRLRYTVVSSDRDDDGISVPGSALTCAQEPRACIWDNARMDIAEPSDGLAAQPGHKVDGRRAEPRLSIVSEPSSGDTYGAGERIEIQLGFPAPVDVTGGPELVLAVGGAERAAAFVGGSGTRSLLFRYTVRAGDLDTDGISIGPGPSALRGGRIVDGDDDPVSRVFTGLERAPGHRVDGVAPSAVRARIASPGDYGLGDEIRVEVIFAERVHVREAEGLVLVLAVGANSRQASYVEGSGSDTLKFAYRVARDDRDEDGVSVGPDAVVGGVIEDDAGNDWDEAARRIPPVPPDREHRVDSDVDNVAPRIVDDDGVDIVGMPSDYVAGETIMISVTFDEDVHVSGQPALELAIGSATRQAAYATGSGTPTLEFRYVVQPDDVDTDGISIGPGPATLAGGRIADAAGNLADRTFLGIPARGNPTVNGRIVTAKVSAVRIGSTPEVDSTYRAGETIEIEIEFSDVVHASGQPTVALSVGADDRDAVYAVGSGTDTLLFRYVVQAGDDDDDGVSIGANALRGGTITNAVGVAAGRDFPPEPANRLHLVDARAAKIENVGVGRPSDGGQFGVGETIRLTVRFDEEVFVTGTPLVALAVGAATRQATYGTGSGTPTLVFGYVVRPGERDDDGVSVPANGLSGGVITDGVGNPVDRRFGAVQEPGARVDAEAPGVDSITIVSPAGDDQTHIPGDVIRVRVGFTDSVHVTGNPVLTLSIGANARPAAFADGSGRAALFFEYTVVEDDYDEDGISIAANALTGGTIADANGNPADLTFEAVAPDANHRVGAETSLLLEAQPLAIGTDLVVNLAGTLEAGGIRYNGPFAATSDNPNVADARTQGAQLTVVPLSEGEATIEIRALRAPITLVLPVTVMASVAETAVLQSALAAVGRGLLGTAADTIGARLELAGMPAGQGVRRMNHNDVAMGLGAHGGDVAPSAWNADPGMFGMAPGGFADSSRSGLAGPRSFHARGRPYRPTSFAIPLTGGMNAGTSWGAWGAAAYQAFEGTPEAGTYDGDLTSFHLGADARAEGWVAGASLSRTQASVAYTYDGDATGAGTLDTELTALHPYVQWRPAPGTTLWTILGFGAGEATAQREGQTATGEPATLGMRLGLAGLRMDLGRTGGFALALRGDAGFVQLETEDGLRAVDGLSVQAQRVRAGVEASRPMATEAGVLSPFVEIGARWDGGDGEAGGGVEVAGGVRYRGPNGGVEVKARTLAMHGGEGVAEHGIAATAFIEPGPQGTGLRLSLTPRWGAPESRDVFWQSDYAMRGMRRDPGTRSFMFDGRIGYGLALRARPGTLEPFGAVGGSLRADSRARLGLRYGAGGHGASRYEVSTERVAGIGRVDYRVLLVAEARF